MVVPASGGIETFSFPAAALFLRAGPEVLRVVDVRRIVGAFLIFIVAGEPRASGGPPPPISAWTILLFFGTD